MALETLHQEDDNLVVPEIITSSTKESTSKARLTKLMDLYDFVSATDEKIRTYEGLRNIAGKMTEEVATEYLHTFYEHVCIENEIPLSNIVDSHYHIKLRSEANPSPLMFFISERHRRANFSVLENIQNLIFEKNIKKQAEG